MSSKSVYKPVFMSISVVLYIVALLLPGYVYENSTREPLWGYSCLMMGALTISFIPEYGNPLPFIAWLSNLPFFVSIIALLFVRKYNGYKFLFYMMFVALIMSLGAFVPSSPNSNPLIPAAGCFVWMCSYLVLLIGIRILQQQAETNESDIR